MMDELTCNPEEFRRKYGIMPTSALLNNRDSEIDQLMQVNSDLMFRRLPKKERKRNSQKRSLLRYSWKFIETICPGIRNHIKDSKKKIFLINAVNMDKLSATERAFFLATDYNGGIKLDRLV